MLRIVAMEDGLTKEQAESLADEERLFLDAHLSKLGLQPVSNFEWAMVKTYLVAKLLEELDT